MCMSQRIFGLTVAVNSGPSLVLFHTFQQMSKRLNILQIEVRVALLMSHE